MFVFYLLLGASQVLAILILILAGYWTGHTLGGFAWDGSSQEFNLHPLLMTLGLIFLYGDAILMFRILRRENKTAVKVIHLLMQALALVCACIALKAVFAFHNKNSIPNLYSLHSWVGLTAFILFACQWLAGFVSFFFPKLREEYRAAYLPLHRYMGVAVFACVIAAAFIGINEKLFFVYGSDPAYSTLPSGAYVGNFLGFFILAFGLIVGYLVTNPNYQREEVPCEETVPLSSGGMRGFQATEAVPEAQEVNGN
ncbi:transmembrane ascorbate-dependent reductase CYB561-like [Diadema setosum]|uniref:transmembrane ascorbate-dependent reductase CYB561-like n=1 Tax=Diadema setosum TaxID=31175 RepID=UPI003B3A6B25